MDEAIHHEWCEVKIMGGRLPAIRSGATSIIFEDNFYLFHGFGAGVGRSADVWKFDIGTGLWNVIETKGNNNDKPSKRDGHSSTYIGDGKLLLFGGQGQPSPNEKSERTLDVVKTKTWSVRDLYNDIFMYDIVEEKWAQLCPEGGVPLCR